jgi:hypothetical protein
MDGLGEAWPLGEGRHQAPCLAAPAPAPAPAARGKKGKGQARNRHATVGCRVLHAGS